MTPEDKRRVAALKLRKREEALIMKKATEEAVDAFQYVLSKYKSDLTPRDIIVLAATASWVIQQSYLYDDNAVVSGIFEHTLHQLEDTGYRGDSDG